MMRRVFSYGPTDIPDGVRTARADGRAGLLAPGILPFRFNLCRAGVTPGDMEPPMTSNDNRNSPRAPLDIFLNKYIRGTPFMARARDISMEGIYLSQLIEPMDDNSKIGIQFQLPGSQEVIYAEGVAIREGEDGHGILFTMLTEHDRKLIRDYIDAWQRQQDTDRK